jgi:serine/threonine protein kinase
MQRALLLQVGAGGAEFQLAGPTVIGRGSDAGVRFKDSRVSKAHAVVEPIGERWRVRDLGSRNGVQVNGASVDEALLSNGDEIGVGAFILKFVADMSDASDEVEALAMGIRPGTVVAGWKFEARIGVGGMAQVYRARKAKDVVAIKVLRISSRRIRDRMLREARLQKDLQHPNLVAVREVIDVAGAPGLVMELVPGLSLAEVLRRTRLDLEQADALAFGLLSGVAEAHQHGLVHRDLKPANVLVVAIPQQDGPDVMIAKVTDFGLAKLMVPEAGDSIHTDTHDVIGTAAYMAPEQLKAARDVDPRADVFSLGVVLYEMVTGQRAFPGSAADAREAVQDGRFVPVTEAASGIPERMVRTIEGAMRVSPAERFVDAAALLRSWVGSPKA